VKKIFAFLTLALFLTAVTSQKALAAERIEKFEGSYQIKADGTVDVVEKITYFADQTPKHGIVRKIDLTKVNDKNQKFVVSVSNLSVDAPYSDQSVDSQMLILRIGDANKTFTGLKIFNIKYTLSGVINYFDDHDEFYWSVTGNNWEMPITDTIATVTLQPTIPVNTQTKATCYKGAQNSTDSCDTTDKNIQFAEYTAKDLGPKEGLTVAFGFAAGLLTQLDPVLIGNASPIPPSLNPWESLVTLFYYLFLPLGVILWWWLFGRDPKVRLGPRSWFEPPKHPSGELMCPAEVGVLADESFDPQDFSATILSLAIRGWLKIKKDGNEYTFTKSVPKVVNDALNKFETIIYEGIFKNGDETSTKNFKSRSSDIFKKTRDELYSVVKSKGYFKHNPATTRKIYSTLGVMSFFTFNILLGITLSVFSKFMPRKTRLGAEKKEEAYSLKRFLSTQERQITFQEQNWYFFEKLLPYAMAFNVTKVWAERFKDISVPTDVSWYNDDDGMLNTLLLANALSSFNTRTSQAFGAAYSSTTSHSGFSSGFSGGFSGGGGGGGGGGSSW